jgi:superoxide reductase
MKRRNSVKKIGDLVQEADWTKEKHVPVIDCADTVKPDEVFEVKVAIGKEIAHPNTTEHHISWISLYFLPDGEKFPYQIGRYEFSAHGASVQGPNTSSVYTHHAVTTWLKTSKAGTLLAVSMCNIHGLWQSSKEIKLK